jgi:hypothetical protein
MEQLRVDGDIVEMRKISNFLKYNRGKELGNSKLSMRSLIDWAEIHETILMTIQLSCQIFLIAKANILIRCSRQKRYKTSRQHYFVA